MYEVNKTAPFWWGMFSLGGVVAALFVPIHIIMAGFLSAEAVGYHQMVALVGNPLIKLYLFTLVSLPLFHAAHRLRYALKDLGLRAAGGLLGVFLYGGAMFGTVVAAYIVATLP